MNRSLWLARALLLGIAASPCLADDEHEGESRRDKVRLLSIVVASPVLVYNETPAILTARVAVRPTDGLASRDDDRRDGNRGSKSRDESKGKREDEPGHDQDGKDRDDDAKHHRFHIEMVWEFLASSAAGDVVALARANTDLTAPFATIRLPSRPTGPNQRDADRGRDGTKTFIDATASVQFDGRDKNNRFLPPGNYTFRVTAYVWRQARSRHSKPKLMGASAPLTGSLVLSPRPAPPSVEPYPVTINLPIIVLVGGKPAGTSLLVGGVEHVALSESTTWSITKTLASEGLNLVVLSDRNAFGLESASVTVPVTLDTVVPAALVVSRPPQYVSTRTISLFGSKEPGSSVLANGVVIVPLDDSATWSATVQLSEEDGENSYVFECVDAAGNRSLAAGTQTASVAHEKAVIGDLGVNPPQISAGQTAEVSYRLFAATPPDDNADLRVSVRIEDGDLLVRELFAGVQKGDPSGPTYRAVWDGTGADGQPALVNTSYRVVVSGEQVAPVTGPRDLVDPNPKESSIVLVGSRHTTSPDRKLEIVFRPDDARLTITPFPPLSPAAGRLLTTQSLHPQGGCYRIAIDRPFSGAATGVLKCVNDDGRLLRPFWWDERQQHWSPVARTNWNPALKQLSFVLPGPGLVVFATSNDVDFPYLSPVQLVGARMTARVRDDSSGVDIGRLRVRRAGVDVTPRVGQRLVNGVHDVELTLDGVESLAGIVIYAADWAGHGRLFMPGERTAP